jgi:hypothetical protein
VVTDFAGKVITADLVYSDTAPHNLIRMDWTKQAGCVYGWLLLDNPGGHRNTFQLSGTSGSIGTAALTAGAFNVFANIGQVTAGATAA